jgi:hypothetical protein
MTYALLLFDDPDDRQDVDGTTMAKLRATIPTVSRLGGAIEVRQIVER